MPPICQWACSSIAAHNKQTKINTNSTLELYYYCSRKGASCPQFHISWNWQVAHNHSHQGDALPQISAQRNLPAILTKTHAILTSNILEPNEINQTQHHDHLRIIHIQILAAIYYRAKKTIELSNLIQPKCNMLRTSLTIDTFSSRRTGQSQMSPVAHNHLVAPEEPTHRSHVRKTASMEESPDRKSVV